MSHHPRRRLLGENRAAGADETDRDSTSLADEITELPRKIHRTEEVAERSMTSLRTNTHGQRARSFDPTAPFQQQTQSALPHSTFSFTSTATSTAVVSFLSHANAIEDMGSSQQNDESQVLVSHRSLIQLEDINERAIVPSQRRHRGHSFSDDSSNPSRPTPVPSADPSAFDQGRSHADTHMLQTSRQRRPRSHLAGMSGLIADDTPADTWIAPWTRTLTRFPPLPVNSAPAPQTSGESDRDTVIELGLTDTVTSRTLRQYQRRKAAAQAKTCIICCDDEITTLIQPCIECRSPYCTDCLGRMFAWAVQDNTMMPPRCCTMIQLSVALPYMTKEDAQRFRSKFEEWLSTSKTYCPIESCSTFIPDRYIVSPVGPYIVAWEVLEPQLVSIIQTVLAIVVVRCYGGSSSPEEAESREWKKAEELFLSLKFIEMRLETHYYSALERLTYDIDLFLSDDDVSDDAESEYLRTAGVRLKDLFYAELDQVRGDLKRKDSEAHPERDCFACPKCRASICLSCKKVAHPGVACAPDTTEEDAAMLQALGYKQCPKCGQAVKKMYGCRHIQCNCGAHWCYYCTKPIQLCNSEGCDSDETADYEEDIHSDYSDLDEMDQASQVPDDGSKRTADAAAVAQSQRQEMEEVPSLGLAAPLDTSMTEATKFDLDAGGARRWEGNLNVGREPDEPNDADTAWFCEHYFQRHNIEARKIATGYPLKLECNRCFTVVHAKKRPNQKHGDARAKAKARAEETESADDQQRAWYCFCCGLVVCKHCKSYYERERGAKTPISGPRKSQA
ncbi:hypothetical protein AAFC00_004599 [Neodothiora populina]|uniref:RING-type domain-containing protein n=1 Tax=Neodothiora populina TaxID=2781224 RepID=A0ABR3P2V8_9PEZI